MTRKKEEVRRERERERERERMEDLEDEERRAGESRSREDIWDRENEYERDICSNYFSIRNSARNGKSVIVSQYHHSEHTHICP